MHKIAGNRHGRRTLPPQDAGLSLARLGIKPPGGTSRTGDGKVGHHSSSQETSDFDSHSAATPEERDDDELPSLSLLSSQQPAFPDPGTGRALEDGDQNGQEAQDDVLPVQNDSNIQHYFDGSSLQVASEVTLYGGKRPAEFGKAKPKKGFKVGRIILFVHDLQKFVQVKEADTRELDWSCTQKVWAEEDRWRWQPATLLLRFEGKSRSLWHECQVRTFCRAEVNIRGDHLMGSINKVQAVYDGIKRKFGDHLAFRICICNFSEHLYMNMTYANAILGEKSVKNSEEPPPARVTEEEAEEVTILSAMPATFFCTILSSSYTQICQQYRSKGEVPPQLLLDENGNCVLNKEELETLVRKYAGDKRERNKGRSSLQVTFQCPPQARHLHTEENPNKKMKNTRKKEAKRPKTLQVIPLPPANVSGSKQVHYVIHT